MKKLTNAELKTLTRLAIKARDKAYAPYSNHPVGCALITAQGKVYSGCNCETANYDSTCAEHAAIAAMVSDGGRQIRAVVTVGPSAEYLCTPCGRCRQRIREFADENSLIYAMRQDGAMGEVYTLSALLPASFGPENVRPQNMAVPSPHPKNALKKKKRT